MVGLDCGLRARVTVEAEPTSHGITYRTSLHGAPLHPDFAESVRETAFRVFSAELVRRGIDTDEVQHRGMELVGEALRD